MKQYIDILRDVYENGKWQEGRNGRVKYLQCQVFKHNMKDGFPILTTKKVLFDRVKSELLWFLSGSAWLDDLKKLDPDNKIWDANQKAWFDEKGFADGAYPLLTMRGIEELEKGGFCGYIYGKQWRDWNGYKQNLMSMNMFAEIIPQMKIDQISHAVKMIREEPESRRIIVSAWEAYDVANNQMCLPPCHVMHQYICDGDFLSLTMYQRSCDLFLGVPFNIASYGLLLEMMAQVTGKIPDQLNIVLNHCHIYEEHMEAVEKQLSREPGQLPSLLLNPFCQEIDDFKMDDIALLGYDPQSFIKAEMKV